MLNLVNLLLQIGSIIGLVGLIFSLIRIIKQRRNIFLKGINILLILLCVAIIIASGYSLLAGTVSISSEPSGAEVYFDDKYVGITPVYVQNVMVGAHSVILNKEGYETAYQVIHVDIQETVSSEISMTKQTGKLQLTANIDGAAVYIDKNLVGYTPLSDSLILGAGKHEVMLTKENYHDVREDITIDSKDTQTLALSLSPVISSLCITSSSSGASVYIDGELAGTTPLDIKNLTLRQHTVELRLAGYESKTDFISLTNQNGLSKSYLLTPKTGSLSITTNPAGLEIYVDGEAKGTSPLTLENLTPGRYTVLAKTEATEYSTNPILNSLLKSLTETQTAGFEKIVDVEAGKVTEVILGTAESTT